MDQDPAMNPYAAIMARKAQLLAQEQAAMQQSGVQPGMPPVQAQGPMTQAQFSGYPQGRPPMSPQQVQQLAALLQKRQ